MSIWTILFVLFFVAMIVMHLRGHGGHGHGGGHGRSGRGDDQRSRGHDHNPTHPDPAETGDRVSQHSHDTPKGL
jgi:hypothetical protein